MLLKRKNKSIKNCIYRQIAYKDTKNEYVACRNQQRWEGNSIYKEKIDKGRFFKYKCPYLEDSESTMCKFLMFEGLM